MGRGCGSSRSSLLCSAADTAGTRDGWGPGSCPACMAQRGEGAAPGGGGEGAGRAGSRSLHKPDPGPWHMAREVMASAVSSNPNRWAGLSSWDALGGKGRKDAVGWMGAALPPGPSVRSTNDLSPLDCKSSRRSDELGLCKLFLVTGLLCVRAFGRPMGVAGCRTPPFPCACRCGVYVEHHVGDIVASG